MTVEKLKDFHRRRLAVLSDAGPDLLALETIPCKLETQVQLLFFFGASIEFHHHLPLQLQSEQ